jgi:hypothetical protein
MSGIFDQSGDVVTHIRWREKFLIKRASIHLRLADVVGIELDIARAAILAGSPPGIDG